MLLRQPNPFNLYHQVECTLDNKDALTRYTQTFYKVAFYRIDCREKILMTSQKISSFFNLKIAATPESLFYCTTTLEQRVFICCSLQATFRRFYVLSLSLILFANWHIIKTLTVSFKIA